MVTRGGDAAPRSPRTRSRADGPDKEGVLLVLGAADGVLKPQQSCCSDDMLKFEHCGASLGVSRELG